VNPVIEYLAWLAMAWTLAGVYVAIFKPFQPEPTPLDTAKQRKENEQ
jgi:hypothetical protein